MIDDESRRRRPTGGRAHGRRTAVVRVVAVALAALALSSVTTAGVSASGSSLVAQDEGGESGTDDGLSTEEWVLLILLGVAAVAVVIGVTAAATSHSDQRNAHRRNVGVRVRDITAGCRWVNDQAVPSVLEARTVDRVTATWSGTRSHMVQLEGKIAALASDSGDSGLDRSFSSLGRSLAGLRGAVEQNVQLRLRPDAAAQGAAILSSSQNVTQRRIALDNALVPVLAVLA